MAYEDPSAPAPSSVDVTENSNEPVDQSKTFLGGEHPPWRRFFARTVDICTAGLVLFLLLLFGTTPAKWLFGISVEHPGGNLLSFSEVLNRSFLVFVQGVGFGIPFVALFTQLFAYRRFTKTGHDAVGNIHQCRGAAQDVGDVSHACVYCRHLRRADHDKRTESGRQVIINGRGTNGIRRS